MAYDKVPSPPSVTSHQSFSSKISEIGAKLTRALSNDRTKSDVSRERLTGSARDAVVGSEKDRSVSRGRDVYQSSGRGGIGNIRSGSNSRDARRPEGGPDDFSPSRGREPAQVSTATNFSTGRGGAGNIRSLSRDAKTPDTPDRREIVLAEEERIIKAHLAADQGAPHSSGRGGVGNISRSRSRGREPMLVHSTGRGGAGNIIPGDSYEPDMEDEEERRGHLHVDGVHSTGRGGAANLTTIHEPGVERHSHEHGDYESTGRGGAGNIVDSRSRSRSRNDD